MRSRLVRGALAAVVLSCAACNDTTSSEPFTTPNGTIVDGLRVLPLGESNGDLQIGITDFSRAAAAIGVEPLPDDATPDDAVDWVEQMLGGRLELELPQLVADPRLLDEPQLVVDEFGWSPYDIDVSAELLGTDGDGDTFTVLKGDLEWTDDAVEGADGLATIGGADGDGEARSDSDPVRPDGQPLFVGARNGVIAAGGSTTQMAGWLSGDFTSARSDPALFSAGERLDAVDAYTARFVRSDFSLDGPAGSEANADLSAEEVLDEPFDTIAAGISGDFAELTSTVVYVFDDNDAAGRAVDRIDDAWRSLDTSGLDGTFEIVDVEQRDDAVVVIARVDRGATANASIVAAASAGLFTHG